jgi:GH15 family glucan-1,4-alpha-glucosidase
LIDAWWKLGRREDAIEMVNGALRYRNRYGLLAEDVHPKTSEACGNFPQTYSTAGMMLAAMRLSRSWEDRYWRD